MKTSPLNVLWVEDSADDIELFLMAIKRADIDFQMHILNDGDEALRYMNSTDFKPPHFILLDLNLPKRDGRELLGLIKKSERLKKIPIVVFSTSSADFDVTRSYEDGASCYLVKPDAIDQLVTLVNRLSAFWELVQFAPRS